MRISKSHLQAAALLLLLGSIGAGCRSAVEIDRLEIARLIQNSTEFKRAKTIRLTREVRERCESALETVENWRKLRDLGIIEITSAEVWQDGTRVSACRAEFSEAMKRDIGASSAPAAAETAAGSAGLAEVPVASRNFMRVVEVNRTEPESTEVSFLWQWQPNVAGRRLGMGNRAFTGRATLWLYSHGWELSRLDVSD